MSRRLRDFLDPEKETTTYHFVSIPTNVWRFLLRQGFETFNCLAFPRFLREVSPSSYLGQTQGLAGNSKSIYEVGLS
jgi:hypothetical protein